ncbi:MAG: hypothetical protein Q8O91_08900 [Candidatus Aminicenantes bacterium]|nr:hypothetical protein [Candidatus Aminicenantes bacterium]
MRTIRIYAGAALLIAAGLTALAQPPQTSAEMIFQEIKSLVLDEKWTEAEARLDDFIVRYPQSPLYGQALYYRSRCLENQARKERAALNSYKEYLRLKDGNKNLAEDAEVSIIDLAMKLYDEGDKGFVREVEERISNPNKVVRYYAAVQLSYVKEKRIADKSVPVLKQILKEEKSAELRDRAKIALMRVSPQALAAVEELSSDRKPRMLRITIAGGREEKIEFSIPWSLADLALAALSEEDKAALRTKGYDIAKIIRDLQSVKGNLIEITADGKRIKIWIE